MKTPDDLNAVDEALATGRADAADPAARELQEIALALQADSPKPAPEFERRLDERVARRFGRTRSTRRRLLPSRGLVLAGAASLFVVIGVAGAVAGLTGGGDGGEEPTTMIAKPAVEDAPAPVA